MARIDSAGIPPPEQNRGSRQAAPVAVSEPSDRKSRYPWVKPAKSSPAAAGIASSVLPGMGQMLTGASSAGAILLIATTLVAGLTVYAIGFADRVRLLEMVTNPDLILVLVAINVVFAGIRLIAASDAWRRAGGRVFGVGLLALIVFTVIPHVAIGYVGLETRSTILKVFGPDDPGAAAAGTTTTAQGPTTSPTPAHPLVPPWTLPTGSSTTSSTTTTTLPLSAGRLTFLLIGTDDGPGRAGIRTDAVMVATVDTRSGDSAVFGLPRNAAGFTFSNGEPFTGFSRGILNEVYMWGQRNPDRFPGADPGIEALIDVSETILGIPIDNYVQVNMAGFADLVDALGGVTINVQRALNAPLYDPVTGEHTTILFKPGNQRVDGAHALAFARSRTGSSDYVRMGRQRCVIGAIVDEAGPLTLARAFPSILDVFENSISTDIPVSRLPYLLNFAPRISTDRLVVVGFDVEYRTGALTEAGYSVVDVPKIRDTVGRVISGSWTGDANLSVASEACG